MNIKNLDTYEMIIVEWQYRMMGGFRTKLMEAINHADEVNLEKLSYGFPDEVNAFRMFAYQPGWWERAQRKLDAVDTPPLKSAEWLDQKEPKNAETP